MAQRKFLVHGRDHSRNTGKVCGECVKETLDNHRLANVGLDVERNVARARCVRNVTVRTIGIVEDASVNGVDQPLGIARGNGDARFVVGFKIVQVEANLVAFDTRHHAVADERFGVAAVIAEAVELCLSDVPSACGEELCRRRALACGPVAVTYEVFEDLGFFAADFLDPRMFILRLLVVVGFEGAEKVHRFGAGGGFFHAVKTATHHEFDKVALASALQAAVAPVTEGVVKEQGGFFRGMEGTAGNQVSAPATERNSQLTGVGLCTHDDSGMFLIDKHKRPLFSIR